MLFGMFIPYQSILIPLVQVLQQMHLYGSLPGSSSCTSCTASRSPRSFFALLRRHPTELVEAAKIDGAGILRIYRWVLAPLSVPGFVVVAIWQFTSIWNDFLFGVIVTSRPSVQPITVALNNMAGSYIVEWNVQMAGAVLAALPPCSSTSSWALLHARTAGRVAEGLNPGEEGESWKSAR